MNLDGQAITYSRAADALNGSVTVGPTGSVNYTPNANYNGVDVFAVSLVDAKGRSSSGNVTIEIAPVNDPPTFGGPNAIQTNEDVTANAQLQATDVDGNVLTYSLINDVQHGTLTVSAQGAVRYTPAANYSGSDSFTARVDDGAGGQATATVTIKVPPSPASTRTTISARTLHQLQTPAATTTITITG